MNTNIRIETASRIVVGIIAVLSVCSVGTLLIAQESNRRMSKAQFTRAESMIAARMMATGSDNLTNAVRAYAATGDSTYKKAFDTELLIARNRDRSIERLRELNVSAEAVNLIESAKRNSDKLLELETRAFAVAATGDWSRAVALVYGDEYRVAKKIIYEPIDAALAKLDSQQERDIQRLSTDAQWSATIALVTIILSFLVVLWTLLEFYRRRVVYPLYVITQQIGRLAAGEKGISFDVCAKAFELAELARTLNHYQAVSNELAVQRERLLELTREQAALFEAAEIGIVLLRGRVIMRCNRSLDIMFGYEAGEQIGKTTRHWYQNEASFAEIGGEIANCVAAGVTHRRELLAMRKDGTALWIRMSGRALDTANPDLGVVIVIEDITQHCSDSEALRTVSDEQLAIFDTVTSGIALVKAQIFIRCNRKLHQMFGWPPEEMVGKSTAICYAGEHANFFGGADSAQEPSSDGELNRREQELKRKDGSLFWARVTGNAVDFGDRSKGTVWVIDDITDEKAAVDEIRRARELAENAARVKSEFVANVSHEIRTPMNVIMGMSYLALKTELTDQQRDYLRKIRTSGATLLGIISDILDFSKIESGKLSVEQVDFQLERVIDHVITSVAESAAGKRLEIVVDVARDVPMNLIGDPLRIGQILMNYVSNAVKFTERGHIIIKVTAGSRTSDGVMLQFSVSDTGIGLAEDQQSRLFKSFEQADSTITRKYGGTGLGLAISKRLAELMGGEVGVESHMGHGSRFWFTASCGISSVACPVLLPAPDLRGRHILVVDDNESSREVTADMLRSMTFIVDQSATGKDAIERVNSAATVGDPFEVVILDWQMPEMDGIAVARSLMALPIRPLPRLIMATAYGRDELLKPAREAGIESILIKPLAPSLLFDAVMLVLGSARNVIAPVDVDRASPLNQDLSCLAGAAVLLVEDNEFNQQVARGLLEMTGIKVTIANDGADAIRMLQSQIYDLVLMDLQMPVMDGISAAVAIRKQPQFSMLPIVAMTANAMSGDRERCIEAGMNDYLAKPIDPDQLLTILVKWIRQQRIIRSSVTKFVRPFTGDFIGRNGEIDGLDISSGLRMALGQELLYVSLLGKFVSLQREFVKQLSAAVLRRDWQGAERLAHGLKGNAAQIGANPVSELAAILELACRAQREDLLEGDAFNRMSDQLPKLVANISKWIARRSAEATRPDDLERAELRTLCEELFALLQRDDFASYRLLKKHEAILRSAFGVEFAALLESVGNFDLALAADQLKKLAADGGIELK